MPTVNYFVSAKKRKLVPIYVRFSAGRKTDLIVKSGLLIDPRTWSNVTQSVKQRIKTSDDSKFIKNLANLKEHIESESKSYADEYSKDWLTGVIYKYHHKKSVDAKSLNDYIQRFIDDAEKGDRTNKYGMKLAFGTISVLKGFKHIFNEYQGIYSEEQLKWHAEKEKRDGKKKPLRPLKKVDFESINIDFYKKFVKFLSDEGYKINSQGKYIKTLKMFMRKSLDDKLHQNREFMHSDFRGLSRESFSVYLTASELDKIYNIDLPIPLQDVCRDAFLVLCETALRISDYKKVDVSIRTDEDGMKLIYITQTKTKQEIIIPCSARLEAILKKYNNTLPKLPEQYINTEIKKIALACSINEVVRWESDKYGKTFERTAQKWELISCHTGRRTACSLMYLAGIPSISIMQISGHRTEDAFLRYIRITREQNARRLATHPYFTKLKAV